MQSEDEGTAEMQTSHSNWQETSAGEEYVRMEMQAVAMITV